VGAAIKDDLSKRRQPPSSRSAKSGLLKSPTRQATAKQKVYGALTADSAVNGCLVAFSTWAAASLSADRRGGANPRRFSLCITRVTKILGFKSGYLNPEFSDRNNSVANGYCSLQFATEKNQSLFS
ncbi:hypothetical protein Ancab_016646, partial [Ancistrocladus abbreviatus]